MTAFRLKSRTYEQIDHKCIQYTTEEFKKPLFPYRFVLSMLLFSIPGSLILSLPFILLYNWQRGRRMKYFFYVYYPLHVYVLVVLARILA